jgi:hypothetical protein
VSIDEFGCLSHRIPIRANDLINGRRLLAMIHEGRKPIARAQQALHDGPALSQRLRRILSSSPPAGQVNRIIDLVPSFATRVITNSISPEVSSRYVSVCSFNGGPTTELDAWKSSFQFPMIGSAALAGVEIATQRRIWIGIIRSSFVISPLS